MRAWANSSLALAQRLGKLSMSMPQYVLRPLGEWLPDLPSHEHPGLLTCKNVVSRTPDSYGPMPGFSAFGSALTARCQGAVMARDGSGNVNLFAGDATKLYRLVAASSTWDNVSRLVGGAYTTGSDSQWNFAQFGTRVIAVNGADVAQSYVIGTDTDFSALAGSPPIASFIAVVKDFVMLGRLSGFPNRVRWAAIDNPADWPTIASADAAAKYSDQQDFVGDVGRVMGLVGGLANADCVVVLERGLIRGIYTADAFIFRFDVMEGARGSPSPGSVRQVGSVFYYLGEDGFYMSDGLQSVPISNNKVASWFFERVDKTYYANISSAADPTKPIVWWAFPGPGSVTGIPNIMIGYNWETRRWFTAEPGVTEYLFVAGTFGYTVDSADAATGWNVDTSPFGPDASFWVGYRPFLAGFNSSHILVYFSGTALAAEFETGDIDIANGRRISVDGIRPIVDGGTVTTQLSVRDTLSAIVNYDIATSAVSDAFCPHRAAGRFARGKVNIASAGVWSHATGYETRFWPEGMQ